MDLNEKSGFPSLASLAVGACILCAWCYRFFQAISVVSKIDNGGNVSPPIVLAGPVPPV